MAALLVVLAIMSLMLSMALPAWHHAAQREREAELIFRGEQYARAIMLYQRQTPGAYPPDVDTLVEGRFLRRAYRDPMTAGGEFRLILQSELSEFGGAGGDGSPADGASSQAGGGTRRSDDDAGNRPGFMRGVRPFANRDEREPGGVDGNIAGVVSRSEEASIALYNGSVEVQRLDLSRRGPGGRGGRRRGRAAAAGSVGSLRRTLEPGSGNRPRSVPAGPRRWRAMTVTLTVSRPPVRCG